MEIVMPGLALSRLLQKHLPEKARTRHLAMESSSYQYARERCKISCSMIEKLLLKNSV